MRSRRCRGREPGRGPVAASATPRPAARAAHHRRQRCCCSTAPTASWRRAGRSTGSRSTCRRSRCCTPMRSSVRTRSRRRGATAATPSRGASGAARTTSRGTATHVFAGPVPGRPGMFAGPWLPRRLAHARRVRRGPRRVHVGRARLPDAAHRSCWSCHPTGPSSSARWPRTSSPARRSAIGT